MSRRAAILLGWGALMLASFAGLIGGKAEAAIDAGRASYLAQCSSCHGPDLRGGQFGPALTGARFRGAWADRASDLTAFINAKMPPANPGALHSQARDVVRFLLAANGVASIAPPTGAIHSASKAVSANCGAKTGPCGSTDGYGSVVGVIPAKPEVFLDQASKSAFASRERLLEHLTPVGPEVLKNPPVEDWLLWRRTYANTSYSPLKNIDRTNIGHLGVAWAWSLPVGSNEITPLVHQGVMFVASDNQVQALDAATGTLLWRYRRTLAAESQGGMNTMKRNIAISGSHVYVGTGDGHVIALDMKSGNLVWDRSITPPGSGILMTVGPIAAKGKIIQGTSPGPRCQGGCSIVALDEATGDKAWTFKTAAGPADPGGDTWNGAAAGDRWGGGVWIAGSYDPEYELLYFGVGQSYYVTPLLTRDGKQSAQNNSALYMDCTLALNPNTGHLVWYHQHMPQDYWDLDEAFERTLIDLPFDGQQRKVVISTGKIGIMDILDRKTGAYIYSTNLGLTNIVKTIDPKTGNRSINPAVMPKANEFIQVCPSSEGARNWMTTAYDPASHIMYFPLEETCMNFRWSPASIDQPASEFLPGMDIGWTTVPVPNSDGNFGRTDALDLATGKSVWMKRYRAPHSMSFLATAGGVLFEGFRDRTFQAVDSRNGETLWETRLNAVPNASPITYMVGGVQYVAIAVGGGGPHDNESVDFTPEIEDSAASTTLWVFRIRE